MSGLGLVGFSGMALIGIYLAAVLEHGGATMATEQLLFVVGIGTLGATIGLIVFDP